MPRLHFNIHNGIGDLFDEEGAEYPDLAKAHDAAVTGIRSLLSAEVMEGQVDLCGHLDMTDDAGRLVERIDFSQVITIVGPDR